MKIKYKFYHDRGLLTDVVEGKVKAQDIRDLFVHLTEPGRFPDYYLVLSDIQNSSLDISLSEIPDFAKLIISHAGRSGFKWAILSSGPKATAISMSVPLIPELDGHIRVFSTIEGCVQFLGVPFSVDEFRDEDYIIFRES